MASKPLHTTVDSCCCCCCCACVGQSPLNLAAYLDLTGPPHLQVAVDDVHVVAVGHHLDDGADQVGGVALGVVAALKDAVKQLAATVYSVCVVCAVCERGKSVVATLQDAVKQLAATAL